MLVTRIPVLLAALAGVTWQVGCCSERRLSRDVSACPLEVRLSHYRQCMVCAKRLSPGAGFSVLMEAARRNDVAAVDHLLAVGVEDVNAVANGNTALCMAVRNGSLPMVEKLLSAGATTAHREPLDLLSVACGQSGMDPLARLGIVRLLLVHGADVNQRDRGGFSAIMAARDGEVAGLLIKHGAQVNAVDRNGANALHMAVARGNRDLASVLIAGDINVNARDAWGRTPLDYAVMRGDPLMVSLLTEHGGTRAAD